MSFTYNDYWKNFRNITGKQYFMDYNSECRSNMAFINKSIMSVIACIYQQLHVLLFFITWFILSYFHETKTKQYTEVVFSMVELEL